MAEHRALFDVLFDNIKSILENYSTQQATIDSSYAYTVYADYYRNYPLNSPGAYVFLSLGGFNNDSDKSASMAYYQYTVEYYLDLIVNKPASSGERGDEAAGSRLRYLIKQMLDSLHAADKRDLDLPSGTIATRPMLRIEPLPPEMQMSERPIVGARLTLRVGLPYEPDRIEGTALESIHVDASRWQALYEYE